jgi:hypothetical protein
MALIRLNALMIKNFFVERGRTAQTFFGNPFFIDFFQNYPRYRAAALGTAEYRKVTQFFENVLQSDSMLESIFFALDATGEYFDEEGRYGEPGYSAKNRTWWVATLEQGRLFCASPSMDLADSTISSTMQMPV